MINIEEVGERIRKCREEKGYTQQKLADEMGYIRQTISNWEKGKINITVDEFIKLCNIFNCDMGYLLGEHETKRRVAADIQKVTGLSETAIEALRTLNTNARPIITGDDNSRILKTINLLIENENVFMIFKAISYYFAKLSRPKHQLNPELPLPQRYREEYCKYLETHIEAIDEWTGKIHMLPYDDLSDNFLLKLQLQLSKLKDVLSKEATTNAET